MVLCIHVEVTYLCLVVETYFSLLYILVFLIVSKSMEMPHGVSFNHFTWLANRILRTLQGLTRFSNVKDLYIAYDVLPVGLHLLHKFCMAKLIYKCIYSKIEVPMVISAMFNLNHACHSYPTRLSEINYLYKKIRPSFL